MMMMMMKRLNFDDQAWWSSLQQKRVPFVGQNSHFERNGFLNLQDNKRLEAEVQHLNDKCAELQRVQVEMQKELKELVFLKKKVRCRA